MFHKTSNLVGVIVSARFHLMCVHIIIVPFRLLSGQLLGNSLSFD